MNPGRKAALDALNRCFVNGAWASQTLDSLINKNSLSPRDAALATRLTVGVIQNYALLDFWIESFCRTAPDMEVRNILRLGMYQLKLCDRIPKSAAVNESVELAKSSGFKSAAGLVNAVLRRASERELPEPEDPCLKFSQSPWFFEKMSSLKGEEFALALLKANNEEAPVEKRRAFASGEEYVQDGAAFEAVLMAEPKPGMRVLDCCSAPGGKSFTSAVLMENRGEILSCDISSRKLRLVEEGAERLGIEIIKTRAMDAKLFCPELEQGFELVIADVPCSGFGVMRKKPEIRFKTREEIKPLPEIQKAIARNVSRYVKIGGRLLYSTCTVFPEENEEVSRSIAGFEILKEKTFYPNVDGTDGFYAAVLERKE